MKNLLYSLDQEQQDDLCSASPTNYLAIGATRSAAAVNSMGRQASRL
jgi:hypothetical protein